MMLFSVTVVFLLTLTPAIGQQKFGNVKAQPRRFLWNRACRHCECGRTYRQQRIVGGRPAHANAFPWLVAITHQGAIKCGGTLLNDRYVMTAAHCLKAIPWREAEVVLGEHDQSSDSESDSETRRILRVIFHPQYAPRSNDNDVSLLRMDSPVHFRRTVSPACLPTSASGNMAGQTGLAAGWGRLKDEGPTSKVLREVSVYIYSRQQCLDKYYMAGERLTNSMMCAGSDDGSRDTCQGDSGGPLMLSRNSNQMEVIGIISWGMACGMEDFPGVYTNVSHLTQWIRTNIRGACSCSD